MALMRKLIIPALLLAVTASAAFAGLPQTISYQGYLKGGGGVPVNTATNVTFRLYSTTSGAGPVWNSGTVAVTPASGVYSVDLGASPQPSLPAFNRSYWLGVTAGADPEMRPLQPLTSVPYALTAASVADNSITASSLAITCAAGQVLVNTGTSWACGMVCSCPADQQNCNGTCANLMTDINHCGSCGTACGAGYACVAGTCTLSCQTGLTNCSGTCTNLSTDTGHCGTCTTLCGPGQICTSGACATSCQTGLTNCAGSCRDLANDTANCGACGHACAAGYVCSAGSCAVSCQSPLFNCNGQCKDIRYDPSSCGTCFTTCTAGQACLNSVCK